MDGVEGMRVMLADDLRPGCMYIGTVTQGIHHLRLCLSKHYAPGGNIIVFWLDKGQLIDVRYSAVPMMRLVLREA